MRWLVVPIVWVGLACTGSGRPSPLGRELADSVSQRCADAPLAFTVARGDTAAERVAAETADLVRGLGFEVDSAYSFTELSPSDAQTLCAFGEAPLAPGDSVVRLVRRPSFPVYGRSFIVRIEARGRETELAAKVLALCLLDSLQAVSPKVWDGRDTLIMLPDLTIPGRIEFETRVRVRRRLFRDVVDYLDKKKFWTSKGVLAVPDAKPTFLEAQLGEQHRVLQLPNFFAIDAPLFRLVEEAGLLEARCDGTPGTEDYQWLVDDAWRVSVADPSR